MMTRYFVFLLGLSLLAACASRAPVRSIAQPDVREIHLALGCGRDEIAFCAGTDCRPRDYYCVSREQALGSVWPGTNP